MKTRITQNIDGYDIIIGIGDAQIDGVATLPVMTTALKETDEYKAVEVKKQELSVVLNSAAAAMKNARNSKTQADKNGFVKEYQAALENSKAIESELKELITPLQAKQKELILKHAVYFQPKQGESLITDDEATAIETAMISATENNCYVDINLKEICDNRGKTAWRKISGKWAKRDISILGDDLKAGEILQSDLSESEQLEITEQLENERISKLSAKEKEAEKTAATNSLGSQAAFMRSTLEIQGDSKALEKSKEWYNAEVEKINVKYGA